MIDGKKLLVCGSNPLSSALVDQLQAASLAKLVIAKDPETSEVSEMETAGCVKFLEFNSFPSLEEIDLVICCSGDFNARELERFLKF